MHYKPYSQEWHRYRYLKEAIDKYLDDGIDPTFIVDDIRDVLHVRSEAAYQEFQRLHSSDCNFFDFIVYALCQLLILAVSMFGI